MPDADDGVPAGDEAIEAAKQLVKKMGFENPQVVSTGS